MTKEMRRRAPTQDERIEMIDDIDELAWAWARRLADLGPDDEPLKPRDDNMSDEQVKTVRLALLNAQNLITKQFEAWMPETAFTAIEQGADFEDIAGVLGVSRQAVEKRWGYMRRGERVAVVISRRDRVREYPDDPRTRVGEVGGDEQYESDRGTWPIGKTVRTKAQYAVVAVDGTVRRVYELVPDGWDQVEPNKWQFTAVGDRPLTEQEVATAYAAGKLPLQPGDDCPTRAGGAYRPHWY